MSADNIVPDGDRSSVVPLTVDFHELQFLAQLNTENQFTRQWHTSQCGRYSSGRINEQHEDILVQIIPFQQHTSSFNNSRRIQPGARDESGKNQLSNPATDHSTPDEMPAKNSRDPASPTLGEVFDLFMNRERIPAVTGYSASQSDNHRQ